VSHCRIALPGKSLPADNLPAKIRPTRQPPGKLLAGGDFSGGNLIMGETLYAAGDILVKRRRINFVIIFFRADISRERHFSVTPAQRQRRHSLMVVYSERVLRFVLLHALLAWHHHRVCDRRVLALSLLYA